MPQPFANVAESVEAYFLNLNTHFAYASFRVERAQQRAQGAHPDGFKLIGQLLRYSQLGGQYISYVRNIIRENQLSDFDRARLSPT
jgi:Bax protein